MKGFAELMFGNRVREYAERLSQLNQNLKRRGEPAAVVTHPALVCDDIDELLARAFEENQA